MTTIREIITSGVRFENGADRSVKSGRLMERCNQALAALGFVGTVETRVSWQSYAIPQDFPNRHTAGWTYPVIRITEPIQARVTTTLRRHPEIAHYPVEIQIGSGDLVLVATLLDHELPEPAPTT